MLDTGEIAPDFELPDQDGVARSLAAYRGSWVVLYFYPKDDTPGCTKEACSFRDGMAALAGLDAVVWGISADDVASHKAFAEKYSLNFPLLADVDRDVIEAYEAWGQKTVGDEVREGILRISYLIDPRGRIAQTWRVEDPESHARDVQGVLERLASRVTA